MRLISLLGVALCWPTLVAAQSEIFGSEPLTCLLNPNRTSEIGSDRAGIVTSVPVSRAQFVRQGDVLVQLDDAFLKSDRTIAQIEFDALTKRLQRSSKLTVGNLISRDEIEQIRTDLAVADAKLARSRLEIARAQVTAPFDGFVADISVTEGELIGPEPLLTLVELNRLKAELVYPVEAFGSLSTGDSLELRVGLSNSAIVAKVVSIDPFIDASSNTFSVVAEVDNSDLRVPAGANCNLLK